MVETPWGNAGELRERMLQPIRGAPRAEVERSQRERLFAAMVALGSERGYEAVSVAALVELAGVSRSDFYRHFEGKEDCFVATERAIMERLGKLVALKYDGRGSALRALIEQIVAQPAAARLCFAQSEAAGAEARALMEGALSAFEGLYATAFGARDGNAEMPEEIPRAIVGGLREVIANRLLAGEEVELLDLSGQLWEWGFGYQAPPRALRRRGQRRKAAAARRAEEGVERLIGATYAVVAERGFGATTIGEIAEAAEVSLSTFYANFATKEEAFEAALDAAQFRLFGEMLPAYRRARSWPEGVALALATIMRCFAAEPELARCVLIEVQTAGPRALRHRERSMAVMRGFLAPGYKRAPQAPAIAAEAIGGATSALAADWVRRGRAERLGELSPTLAYVALAPFLGAAEACAVALGEGEIRPGAKPLRDRG